LESILGKYFEGEVYDLEHDEYTIKNWIETGHCEEVKEVKETKKVAKSVKQDEAVTSTDK
jgi:hypothetical protein